MFIRDSNKVLRILNELNIGTDVDTWIKGFKWGRKYIQELQTYYDGTSEGARRNKFSRAYLNNIFYKNKTTFTFEKYVKKVKVIFNALEKYGFPLYEEYKVVHLLDQIISPNTELNMEVIICRSSNSSILVKYSTYLSTVISRLYPPNTDTSARFRKHSIYATFQGDCGSVRGGHFRGCGNGGRGSERRCRRVWGGHIGQCGCGGDSGSLKMELTYQMSPVTLMAKIGPCYQTKQE